ncbi:MAG TPA: TRAP transporter small permease subunit [Polyangiales bacterium]|nr:TRAP transporter small permease subunit [Polyangiales bacterium]
MKRFNDGLARGEAALATAMLLLMLVVAFAQAFLRNLSNYGVGWANVALGWLDWSDFIISKGTLWLAFLGASLAVHADKHISIDIVPRLVSPKARILMRGASSLIASVICFALARAFWTAVLINGDELPASFAVLDMSGNIHVCDAGAALLEESGGDRPGFFCAIRAAFLGVGVKLETPGAMFQLIAPVMLVFMSVRFFGQGLWELIRVAKGDTHDDVHAHGVTGVATEVARTVDPKDAP